MKGDADIDTSRESAKQIYRSQVDRIILERPRHSDFSNAYRLFSSSTQTFHLFFFHGNEFKGWENTPQEEINEYNNERIAQEKRFYEVYKDLMDGLEE